MAVPHSGAAWAGHGRSSRRRARQRRAASSASPQTAGAVRRRGCARSNPVGRRRVLSRTQAPGRTGESDRGPRRIECPNVAAYRCHPHPPCRGAVEPAVPQPGAKGECMSIRMTRRRVVGGARRGDPRRRTRRRRRAARRQARERRGGRRRGGATPVTLEFAAADLTYVRDTAAFTMAAGLRNARSRCARRPSRPRSSGDVADLTVREGDTVQAGQLLARIDTADLEAKPASPSGSARSRVARRRNWRSPKRRGRRT